MLDKLPQENKSVLRRLLDLMRHWRGKLPADSNFYDIAKFFRPVILRSQSEGVSRDQFMVIAVLQYLIQEVDCTDEDSFMSCVSAHKATTRSHVLTPISCTSRNCRHCTRARKLFTASTAYRGVKFRLSVATFGSQTSACFTRMQCAWRARRSTTRTLLARG